MADTHDTNENLEFSSISRALIIAEIRAMIKRLQEHGEFQLTDIRFEDLDLRGLRFLKRELRDTLRTLGGGR